MDDATAPLGPTYSMAEAEKLAARKKYLETTFSKFMGKFDDALGANPSGLFVGSDLTICDLNLYASAQTLSSGFLDGIPTDCLSKYPNIIGLVKKVGELPKIA